MHPGRLIYALLGAGLVILAVVAGALALGFGPPLPNDPSEQAALASFTSTGGTCVDEPGRNTSTEMRSEDGVTFLTVRSNVTVPATNYGLDTPTFERIGPSTYALNVTSEEDAEKPPQECPGVAQARFTASLQLPHAGDEPFTVIVNHDGEAVGRVHQGEDGASVSASVDASEGTTTAS